MVNCALYIVSWLVTFSAQCSVFAFLNIHSRKGFYNFSLLCHGKQRLIIFISCIGSCTMGSHYFKGAASSIHCWFQCNMQYNPRKGEDLCGITTTVHKVGYMMACGLPSKEKKEGVGKSCEANPIPFIDYLSRDTSGFICGLFWHL